ncbi:MAG: tRNA 4-thiouridine(8) synthase ThiI [Spirochaetales bacterium]|nr:tRNA 4-thiouridine(8) synthase ThiI [Spirochaetales bacterium]
MAKKLYLIKLGEISLKGQNRNFFEKRLRHNIKDKLRPYHSTTTTQKGRIFFYIVEACPDEVIEKALTTTFGIVGYAKAAVIDKSYPALLAKAKEVLINSPFKAGVGSFKIETKREDKDFEKSSYEINCELADVVNELYPNLTVSMKNPDFVLHCEVRKQIYVYTSTFKGMGGLPAGTAGRGLLLLSGGIDSPVAGIKMAKRGMKMDYLYFHAYPYTSELALEKVKTLASLIAPYTQGGRLLVIPFTAPQLHIRDKAYEEETTLMFRAAMMQTASQIAQNTKAEAIITGEALSQVASQTLPAMAFSDSMSDLLVLRPLVGMDKEEIISVAEKVNTYETSILPYEDCCVIFSPKHPITNPVKEVVTAHYQALEMEELINDAINNIETFYYNAKGELFNFETEEN